MTAHRITRIGMARARGEHLVAANDALLRAIDWSNEGRHCACCQRVRELSRCACCSVWCAMAGASVALWTLFYAWLTA
jgi:hypothetical protein